MSDMNTDSQGRANDRRADLRGKRNVARVLFPAVITTKSVQSVAPYQSEATVYAHARRRGDGSSGREMLTGVTVVTETATIEGEFFLAYRTIGGHWEGAKGYVEGDANEAELDRISESILRRDSDSRLELWGIQTPATYPLVVEANAKVVVNELIDGVQKIRYADFEDLKGEDGAPGQDGQDGLERPEVEIIWCDMWKPGDLPDGDWLNYDPDLHTGWECDYPDGGWVALINRLIDEGIIVGFWKTGDADGSTTKGSKILNNADVERIDLANAIFRGFWEMEKIDAGITGLRINAGTLEVGGDVTVGIPTEEGDLLIADGGVVKIANKQVVGNQEAAIADAPVDAKADYVAADVDTDTKVADALNALAAKVNAVGGKANDILAALRSHGLIAP